MNPLSPAIIDLLAGRAITALSESDVAMALQHRIHGLVLAADRRSGGEILSLMPMDVHRRLGAVEMQDELMSARSAAALDELSRHFGDVGLPVRVFKGAALSRSLYTDSKERPHSDLDVQIGPIDDALELALRNLGLPDRQVSAAKRLSQRGRPIHEFQHGIGGFAVDFHSNPYGLLDPPRDPELIDRSFRPLPGHDNLMAPTPELSLMISAINLARKGGGALWHAADIARLLEGRDGPVDWDSFVSLAENDGLSRTALAVLDVVVTDLGLERPAVVPIGDDRPTWAPALGEVNAQYSIWRRGTLVSVRRPLRFTPSTAWSFARWYAPGPALLDLRGVPRRPYLPRLLHHWAKSLDRAQEERSLSG